MGTVKKEDDNIPATLKALLSQIKTVDPEFKQFLRQEISKSYKQNKQNDIAKETIRRLRIQNKKLLQQVSTLKERVKQMKAEKIEMLTHYNQTMKLNNSLSSALGSCNICWGENQDCPVCSGNGYPGWRTVNKRLFNIYILPSLEKYYRFKINNN
jgi:hypothetical protein